MVSYFFWIQIEWCDSMMLLDLVLGSNGCQGFPSMDFKSYSFPMSRRVPAGFQKFGRKRMWRLNIWIDIAKHT